MQAINGMLRYFFIALLQGHSSSEMKENVHRLEKTGPFFSDYGSSLLVTMNIFSATYISISVRL
jgi:hypothetical protein